eukprot:3276480-Amphidinium_carterae.1
MQKKTGVQPMQSMKRLKSRSLLWSIIWLLAVTGHWLKMCCKWGLNTGSMQSRPPLHTMEMTSVLSQDNLAKLVHSKALPGPHGHL